MRRTIVGALVVVTLLLLLSPLVISRVAMGHVNDLYPPRSPSDAQKDAVEKSSSTLLDVSEPNVLVSLSSENVGLLLEETIQFASVDTDLQLDDVDVRFGEQAIAFSADFSGRIDDIGVAATGTVTGAVAVASEDWAVVLTPALDRVQLVSLDVGGFRLPAPLSRTIAAALDVCIGNINGRIKPVEFETPAKFFAQRELRLADRVVEIPEQRVVAASLLVDPDRVAWLGEVAGDRASPMAGGEAEGPRMSHDYDTFKKSFMRKGSSLFGMVSLDGIAISPELLEEMFGDLHSPGGIDPRAEASLDAAWRNAHLLSGPDVSVSVPGEEVTHILKSSLASRLQTAAAGAGVSLSEPEFTLGDGTLGLEAVGTAEFRNPTPGRATLRISLSVSPVSKGDTLVLLPSLEGIKILSAAAEGVDAAKLVMALNSALTGLQSSLGEALPGVPINLGPFLLEEISLASAETRTTGLTLSPKVIASTSIRLEQAAILLTQREMTVLADVATDSESLVPRDLGVVPEPRPAGVDAVQAFFRAAVIRGDATEGRVSVGLSWARLAELVNAHWADSGGIRARYTFDTGTQPMDSTAIELVRRPTYECKRGRRCAFDDCGRRCGSCDRDCGSWEVFCEIEQAACRVKKTGCLAECYAVANTEKAFCDATRELEKAGCELGRLIQGAASHVGGVGRIGGSLRASGAVAADTAVLSLTPDRPGIRFAPEFSGALHLEGTLSFVPYDVGHVLVCPAKGSVGFSADVAIPGQAPTVNVSLTESGGVGAERGAGDLSLVAKLESFRIQGEISPSPAAAILSQNPHLFVVCNPVLGAAVAGLTLFGEAEGLVGTDLIRSVAGREVAALLTGEIDYSTEDFVFSIGVESTELAIGETTYKLLPRLGGGAVSFSLEESGGS